jgi:hypothetical protein
MIRRFANVFHEPIQSSFAAAVNAMWKLCKAGRKSEPRPGYAGNSEEFGTDF